MDQWNRKVLQGCFIPIILLFFIAVKLIDFDLGQLSFQNVEKNKGKSNQVETKLDVLETRINDMEAKMSSDFHKGMNKQINEGALALTDSRLEERLQEFEAKILAALEVPSKLHKIGNSFEELSSPSSQPLNHSELENTKSTVEQKKASLTLSKSTRYDQPNAKGTAASQKNKGSSTIEQESLIKGIIQNELPEWLQTYLSWHRSKRAELAEMDDSGAKYDTEELRNLTKDFRFLAVVVLDTMSSGGIADRMKSYPYWLMKANQTNRILLFHWNKDNHFLSDYLIPPPGGMDWMVPSDKSSVLYKLLHDEGSCLNISRSARLNDQKKRQLACVKALNSYSFPLDDQQFYHNRNGQNSYPYVFHTMFQPSTALEKYIEKQMISMGGAIKFDVHSSAMTPYLAVHIRSGYPLRIKLSDGSKAPSVYPSFKKYYDLMAYFADHAVEAVIDQYKINTGSHTIPPIYVASDSPSIIKYLREDSVLFGGTRLNNATVNAWQYNETPTFLAVDENEDRRPTHSHGYSKSAPLGLSYVFFDQWMLSNSHCLAYGVGGYGKLAATFSMSSQGCQINHQPEGAKYEPLAASARKYWYEKNLTSHFYQNSSSKQP